MPEGFLAGLQRYWLLWSGWLFTVAGTVTGLAWGGAFAWIGAMVAASGLLALTGLALDRHKELQAAVARQKMKDQEHATELRKVQEQAEHAERRLNEIPADIVLRLQEMLAGNSFRQWVTYLLRHAKYVERMVGFFNITGSRPPSLRTFVNQGGNLYAVGRVDATAINSLKDGDPLILSHKDAKGLLTDSARLVVHQRNEAEGTVCFRIEAYLSDEMPHLDALAAKKDIAGLTGYSLRPTCVVQNYANVNLVNASNVIGLLADEIALSRGFEV
jgi:hypothetical protein